MPGISVRVWVVAGAAALASLLSQWHPWRHEPQLPWWVGFGLVVPVCSAAIGVRGWPGLWLVGFPSAILAQFGMTALLRGIGQGTGEGHVLHAVIETTVLALLYGLLTAFAEAWIERSERRPEPC